MRHELAPGPGGPSPGRLLGGVALEAVALGEAFVMAASVSAEHYERATFWAIGTVAAVAAGIKVLRGH